MGGWRIGNVDAYKGNGPGIECEHGYFYNWNAEYEMYTVVYIACVFDSKECFFYTYAAKEVFVQFEDASLT